ncbi:uncharacterized protein BO97DRAFT_93852 [Aspergillus homomorphus CBS 101889]|uniref:Rhodopsin domain-containing protein n=1 Tax=Aspergillus homomorphus (strain CBS 101889) TaxID=1450537 RepID=A0A395HVA4_ASPHC|nr:hypothetical protein BO97DRAFT_93852 [Aspergillus homomorphus CBS 101889]RAL11730.1 hypothetical protein BO97DRAFT_93852 [Aspergillus homomorphus CBS 101889]
MDQNVGAIPPPPGVTPDFNSRPWLFTANRVSVAVGVTVCSMTLIMRLYTKACIVRQLWWDDVLIFLAWVFVIATQATILYGYNHSGVGIDFWNVGDSLLVAYRKTVLALSILYIPALAFAKLAVIMLYYRLLKSFPMWRYTLWFIGSGICAYSTALIFALIFACKPIKDGWTLTTPNACRPRASLYLGTAIGNTASDVVLILIPTTFIWTMHLPRIQKIGLFCMLGIGCLTVVTSIVRLITLIPLNESYNRTHLVGLACLLIVIEANFLILCGSLPYLRPFLRHHVPKLFDERQKGNCTSTDDTTPDMRRISRRSSIFDIESIGSTHSDALDV